MDCKEHNYSTSSSGYSNTTVNGVWTTRHKKAWEEYAGFKVPNGGVVRHSCHNKKCIEPTHLTLGTAKQNTEDSVNFGLMSHGDRHPMRKLTSTYVQEIKFLLSAGFRHDVIAEVYGVSRVTITDINTGKTWKNV